MRGIMNIIRTVVLIVGIACCQAMAADDLWQTPFDTVAGISSSSEPLVTFGDAVQLVAERNPLLKSLIFVNEDAQGQVEQSAAWPNPELETEFEEVGWDAPGFSESEFAVSISQEFELFGQRGARRRLALAGSDATSLATTITAFDLYLAVKGRYFNLAHAQQQSVLADLSVALAETTLDNIVVRIDKGASLESELLLARLELQRIELMRDEFAQDISVAQTELASLWGEDRSNITVGELEEPKEQQIMSYLPSLYSRIDSSRHVLPQIFQANIVTAEKQMASAETKPVPSLSGGYKHNRADGSNSFLFGISIPIPLLNRNQGAVNSLEARLRSLEYERQHLRLRTGAEIRTGITRLEKLSNRHMAIDTLLLPTAEDAFNKLVQAYQRGRVPYTNMLEAARAFMELRFEHNDVVLEILQQIIELERITGASLLVPR